jgi:predicted class III extradiol MEMO1 family dioxygenase
MVILSMDLSHYKSPEGLAAQDERTLKVLTKLDFGLSRGLDVDARHAAWLTLRLFKDLGASEGLVLERRDCSFFLGKRVENGVSYATIVFRSVFPE